MSRRMAQFVDIGLQLSLTLSQFLSQCYIHKYIIHTDVSVLSLEEVTIAL